jgi:cell division protein FtsI/penicillin-binding protein 2
MAMKIEHSWRYTILGTVFSLVAFLIVAQLVRIQTNPEQIAYLKGQAAIYGKEWKTFYPARGQIYDRYGHLLAGNIKVYEVGVDLASVQNPRSIALALNVVLGLDYSKTLQIVSQDASANHVYEVVDDYVTQDKIDRLTQLGDDMAKSKQRGADRPSLRGLQFKAHFQRSYPEKALASNILGFVSREGTGYFGVEAKFNDLLAGQPVSTWIPSDPNKVEDTPQVPDGASLVLTIDREIQKAVEEIADKAVESTGSDSATILVYNPRTGEVLAMATTPRLDPNQYWRYGEVFKGSTPFDRAISQAYEPGSVYKVLTMAAALDKGAVKPDTSFLDTGVFEIGGVYIYNWNSGAWGPQTMEGCLQHSLNVCLAWVASQLGTKDFYAYMNAFGIGRQTGVDLAGEASGRLKVPGDGDWYEADLGTNAFGQGVAVTPLQLAAAIASVANDGKVMTPRIVKSMVKNGYQFNTEPHVSSTPIKPETAHTLTEMLATSLEEEASDALVEGYRVAGKTGTAQIPTPYGYSESQTNASFVGWGPVDDPRFLVYVWLEKPSTSIWGSVVASPIFRQVVEKLVVLMDIPPDAVRKQLSSQ